MRLKTLIATAIACTATLGATATAEAKSDKGNGQAQRCVAAQNGQHRGFQCEPVVDDTARECPRGYELTAVTFSDYSRDANDNGVVCSTRA